MNKRVSVDADALQEFIKSARSDHAGLAGEFCGSQWEHDAEMSEFENGVFRLDIKDM